MKRNLLAASSYYTHLALGIDLAIEIPLIVASHPATLLFGTQLSNSVSKHYPDRTAAARALGRGELFPLLDVLVFAIWRRPRGEASLETPGAILRAL